ncbi:MAG TPA: glycosyltransferase family 2 protein [Pyrinomonadaceae bacterium]|nr:glycosyltransferase family 2 protein [Pyrinomonadaceae bacterium]
MYKSRRIAVVIPAYNEARHVGQVVAEVPDYVDHVVVVDDCSTDDTPAVIESIGDARVVALRTPKNLGVGGATMLGYERALELGCDIAVKMDGDGQMPPQYVHLLLDAIVERGYAYAKGNRFLAGESLTSMPRHRLFGNVILTFLNKLASGYWHIFDPQNGYTAISAETLRLLNFPSINQRYFFENDMLIELNFHNARVVDVAIPARYGDEVSGLNPISAAIKFPLLFLPRFWRRIYQKYVLRDFSPIALFLFLGLLLCVWGVGFGAYHWILSVMTDHVATTGTVMLAVLPLILGFQLILEAIVLDIQETPR